MATSAPATNLTGHDGNAFDSSKELFVPPSPQLGQLLSAGSTLVMGKRETPIGYRLAFAALPLALGVAIVATNRNTGGKVGLGVCAFIALIVWFKTAFRATCTYIGRDGISSTVLAGKRSAPPTTTELLFRNAVAMFTSQTHHYRNGAYQNTSYNFYWVSPQGGKLFSLAGSYNRNKPPTTDMIHFARAAEIAWSQHYIDAALQQLDREGSIAFVVDGRRVVRVGPGFLEFVHFDDHPVRVTKAEIAKVTLGNGEFLFKHVDAKWYSREGKFKFSYANMANARVFLLVLDKLMGYRWS
jgi:hypothetical protein